MPAGGKDNNSIIRTVKDDTADPVQMKKKLEARLKTRNLSDDLIGFIFGLLTVDPKERLTANQALKHKWLTNPVTTSDLTLGATFSAEQEQESDENLINNLKKFKKMDLLKRSALLALSLEMSSSELQLLNKSFTEADANGDGLISFKEFESMMQKQGIQDRSNIQEAFAAIDQDGAGLIQYSEFIAGALQEQHLNEASKVEAAFRRLDMDDSGTLTVTELQSMLPEGLDKDAIMTVLDAADCTDKDGVITLAEFKKAMMGHVE